MMRRARQSILYDGCYAHVYSRSIEERFIFKEKKDFDLLKVLLCHAKAKYPFRIFHYCFMHTHFHLAVGIRSFEAFSQGMKWFKWQYTKEYNQAHKRRGTVWQGRFNSLLIEDERYLRACGLYIENNPVGAGLVKTASQWEYSSSRFYEEGRRDNLVDAYEWDGALPAIEEEKNRFFEKGAGIGSPLFQLHLKEEFLNAMPVP